MNTDATGGNAAGKTGLRDVLRENGSVLFPIHGVSMLPMLRQSTDCVYAESVSFADLRAMDVVLYQIPGMDSCILHRLLRKEDGRAVILGDNCTRTELIPAEWIMGRMSSFFRGERQIMLSDPGYRLYVALWARPWRMRVLLLKAGHRIRRAAGKARMVFAGNRKKSQTGGRRT